MNDKRIAFVASDSSDAQAALRDLTARYKGVRPEEADIVVALGGDGFMLRILHDDIAQSKPIFGINRGSVGFLMNEYRLDDLERRLSRAEPVSIRPLRMTATTVSGEVISAIAINDVSLFRENQQAAKVRITVDSIERLEELICDGVLLSTPAGSTASSSTGGAASPTSPENPHTHTSGRCAAAATTSGCGRAKA